MPRSEIPEREALPFGLSNLALDRTIYEVILMILYDTQSDDDTGH
jgi:hypothetical protein